MPNNQDNTMTSERNDRISKRGFASMDRTRQREIARLGGRAAHQRGTAHEFTRDEAREAGRKGGVAVSQDREHMAKIGRRGGERRSARLSSLRTGTATTGSTNTEDTVEMPAPGTDVSGENEASGNDRGT
jgi:general stress protein YciG